MAARESSHASAAPKEQPPPESLRHHGPRAPDGLERGSGNVTGAAEGAKLSGARDRRGRQARLWRALAVAPFAGAQCMSREVHNGPTDETQARATPYSGDLLGGDG